MIALTVGDGTVRVRLGGLDAFMVAWRPSWTWEEPLDKVVRVDVVPGGYGGARIPWRRAKGGELRCAHRRQPALIIDLDGATYRRVRLSVPDPQKVATALGAAIGAH